MIHVFKKHLVHFSVHAFIVQLCYKSESFFGEWEGFLSQKVVEGLLLKMQKVSFLHIHFSGIKLLEVCLRFLKLFMHSRVVLAV